MEQKKRIIHIIEERICRCCAEEGPFPNFNINENCIKYRGEIVPYIDLLNFIFNFKIRRGDGKPHTICESCQSKAIDFYHFKKKSELAQERLIPKYNLNEPDTVVVKNESVTDDDDNLVQFVKCDDDDSCSSKLKHTTKRHREISDSGEDSGDFFHYIGGEKYSDDSEENWQSVKRKSLVKNEDINHPMGEPCGESCRFGCSEKLSHEDRLMNHRIYWEFSTKKDRTTFLQEYITTEEVKSSTVNAKNPRVFNFVYYLQHWSSDGKIDYVKVCRLMFIKTLGIRNGSLHTISKKLKENSDEGALKRRLNLELRLKNGQMRANEYFDRLIEHPVNEDFAMADIHNEFKQEWESKGLGLCMTLIQFQKIFQKRFDYIMDNADKMICGCCFTYLRASDADKTTLKVTYDNHLKDNVKCRNRGSTNVTLEDADIVYY